jgi:hypothetical protein
MAAALASFIGGATLAQSGDDKVKDTTKDVKRTVKKTGHRVEEAVCTGSKADCALKKAGHRIEETKDKVVDKVD